MNEENGIRISSYEDRFAADFKRLNYLWLQKFFVPEEEDEIMLSNPKSKIIDKDGFIFFALKEDEVVGTCALIKMEEDVYELSKMAVLEQFQGRQIGQQLLTYCINEARAKGAHKIILYSNTALKPAIHLYKKYGFKEVELKDSVFERANIQMELVL